MFVKYQSGEFKDAVRPCLVCSIDQQTKLVMETHISFDEPSTNSGNVEIYLLDCLVIKEAN